MPGGDGSATRDDDEGVVEEKVPEAAPALDAGEQDVDVKDPDTDPEILAMKQKVREMEEEAAKIRQMQDAVEKDVGLLRKDSSSDIDERSVYVGSVDYSATNDELLAHFQSCGTIVRVTILMDKFTGHPKGYAYVEFAEKDSVSLALHLNDTLFKGRQLKVSAKRTNVPGYTRGRGRGRGGYGSSFGPRRGFRGRRFGYHPYRSPY